MKDQLHVDSFCHPPRLVHSGKAPDGVMSFLAGIRRGQWSLVLAPGLVTSQNVPDRGKVVTVPIFVQRRLLHPDVYHVSNTSIEQFRF